MTATGEMEKAPNRHRIHIDKESLDRFDPVLLSDLHEHAVMAILCDEIVNMLQIQEPLEVSLTLCDDFSIQKINESYRNKAMPTDVLSFPLQENLRDEIDLFPGTEALNLGDILISVETCAAQARTIGHSFRDEFYRLLVHGFLHLVGYDHEVSATEKLIMEEQEDALLELLSRQDF